MSGTNTGAAHGTLGAKLLNAVGFQIVWFGSVGLAATGPSWPGPLAALLFIAAMLGFGGRTRADLVLLAVAVPLGLALDSLFAASGWLRYASPWPSSTFAPAWIVGMWGAFALTLNHSLAYLRERPWVAATFGLIGGPLSYWGASRGFQAVTVLADPRWVYAALGLGWAIALTLLFAIARRGDRPLRMAGAAA